MAKQILPDKGIGGKLKFRLKASYFDKIAKVESEKFSAQFYE